ncbi:hypothetical protein Ancab_015017 [Ancistrocladus abbreviatus]
MRDCGLSTSDFKTYLLFSDGLSSSDIKVYINKDGDTLEWGEFQIDGRSARGGPQSINDAYAAALNTGNKAAAMQAPVTETSWTRKRMQASNPGHSSTPGSSPSTTHPSIKPRPKGYKIKGIRRRRYDFECGCTTFIHLGCKNNGNHPPITSAQGRLYLGDLKSPIFHRIATLPKTPLQSVRHHHHPVQIQPQPQESTGSPQSLPDMGDLDSTDSVLRRFLEEVDPLD